LFRRRYPFESPHPRLQINVTCPDPSRSEVTIRASNKGNVVILPSGWGLTAIKDSPAMESLPAPRPIRFQPILPREEFVSQPMKIDFPLQLIVAGWLRVTTNHLWYSAPWPLHRTSRLARVTRRFQPGGGPTTR
jgi:hypothetical protein